MVRIARERIDDLFGLAEQESQRGELELAHRYVVLAREIGARYNVRLLPEYREMYCRGCSTYWVEGRTVRTRLRPGHRVRTCLRCGRARRSRIRRTPAMVVESTLERRAPATFQGAILVGGDEDEHRPERP